MHGILDEFEEDVEIVETKWFPILGFGLVYAIYAYFKFDVAMPHIADLLAQYTFLSSLFSLIFLVSYVVEFALCIINLRRYKYLSNKELDVFLVCYLYSILGYTIYYLVKSVHLGFSTIILELGIGLIFICLISTPIIIIADKLIDYIKYKQFNKKNE